MMTNLDIAVAFCAIARDAGMAIMRIYESGTVARLKDDRSPVTDADEQAEAIILVQLRKLFPDIPVVAEESAARGETPAIAGRFILVDPLDGTKEFINRNGEFTVNIALIENGRPVAGVVYAPAIDAIFAGADLYAWRETHGVRAEIRVRTPPTAGMTALCSRSHPDAKSDAFLADLPIAERIEAGSSLKLCRIAEGVADVYPRFGPTMEWDIAAGHAVLAAAGGAVLRPDGAVMPYGKAETGFRNEAFVAWASPPGAASA
jgi:3'(2'), 5'-bisphosphate nucleotidase